MLFFYHRVFVVDTLECVILGINLPAPQNLAPEVLGKGTDESWMVLKVGMSGKKSGGSIEFCCRGYGASESSGLLLSSCCKSQFLEWCHIINSEQLLETVDLLYVLFAVLCCGTNYPDKNV